MYLKMLFKFIKTLSDFILIYVGDLMRSLLINLTTNVDVEFPVL